MPLLKIERINAKAIRATWRINEAPQELNRQLYPSDNQTDQISNPKKRAESIAARLCLQAICKELAIPYTGIYKDTCDKPSLIEHPNIGISIAHAYPYAVAMIHTEDPCGIDVEKIDAKVSRVGHKFLNDAEIEWVNQDVRKQIIVWSAKETLYKIHGRKNLSFKDNMVISPSKDDQETLIKGSVMIADSQKKYTLAIEQIEDYIITFLYD